MKIMNRLKTFENFINEKSSPYDEIVQQVLNTIESSFDYECLQNIGSTNNPILSYKDKKNNISLNINIHYEGYGFYSTDYKLSIDDEIINCSNRLKRKLYEFLEEKFEDKKLDKLRKKYLPAAKDAEKYNL